MSSGGGSSPPPSNQTVTQTNVPEYLRPFLERLAGRSEAASNRPYEAYTGPRLAEFTPDQLRSQEMARNIGQIGQTQIDLSNTLLRGAGEAGLGINYTPQQVQARREFDAAAMDQYMNPFLQGVLERSRAGATRTLQEQLARNRANPDSAPFGSYANAVTTSLVERDFGDRLADTEARLLSEGFGQAQAQFERDRRFGYEVDTGNRDDVFRGAQFGLNRAGALAGLSQEALRSANEQRRLYGGEIDALGRIGLDEQRRRQANLDLAYEDFRNQRDYERNNLSWLSAIMRGLPAQMSTDVSQFAPAPNPYSQLLGLGTSAAGLANLFGAR